MCCFFLLKINQIGLEKKYDQKMKINIELIGIYVNCKKQWKKYATIQEIKTKSLKQLNDIPDLCFRCVINTFNYIQLEMEIGI